MTTEQTKLDLLALASPEANQIAELRAQVTELEAEVAANARRFEHFANGGEIRDLYRMQAIYLRIVAKLTRGESLAEEDFK